MYGLSNSARISTNSLVLDKLSQPSKIMDTHDGSILRLWDEGERAGGDVGGDVSWTFTKYC